MRYCFVFDGDDDEVLIHMDQVVSKDGLKEFDSRQKAIIAENLFAAKFFDVVGIDEIVVGRYWVLVRRAQLFQWETILPEILIILEDFALDGIVEEFETPSTQPQITDLESLTQVLQGAICVIVIDV